MAVVDFQKLQNKKQNQLRAQIREFADYYEYCFIKDYEDKYDDFEIHSVELGQVHAGLLVAGVKTVLTSILFFKDIFNLDQMLEWLELHSICIITDEDFIKGSRVIDALLFNGRPIILFLKGNKKITIDTSKLVEVTETYEVYQEKINTSCSKYLKSKGEHPSKIIVNGEVHLHIDRIELNKSSDLVFSNGNLIIADYIDYYMNKTLGFFRYNEEHPIACIGDPDTDVYIDIYQKDDDSLVLYIDFKYIIDPN